MTTLPDAEAAGQLVRTLLEERLVACGNVIQGVVSLYRWDGAVRREGEVILLLKSTTGMLEGVFARIAELHPYSVPELLTFPAAVVGESYRRWVVECLQG